MIEQRFQLSSSNSRCRAFSIVPHFPIWGKAHCAGYRGEHRLRQGPATKRKLSHFRQRASTTDWLPWSWGGGDAKGRDSAEETKRKGYFQRSGNHCGPGLETRSLRPVLALLRCRFWSSRRNHWAYASSPLTPSLFEKDCEWENGV